MRNQLKRLASAIGTHGFLIIFVLISLFPVYLMFVTSLKSQAELIQNVFALPHDAKWDNYPLIVIQRGYYRAVINSLLFAGSVTIITIALSLLAAYAFAVFDFVGRQLLFVLVLVGLMVSEVSILIPVYQLLKSANLLNTFVGLVLPQIALGLSFGIFLMTTFFREVPKDLVDAARLDGCTDLQLLMKVMIPVGLPAISALAVIEFLWTWNSFFLPLVIATKQELMPLAVSIIDFMGRFTFNYELVATTCVIMFVPILILYILTQRSFRRGVTMGAVK
ncbi:MAG: carbohydrate ABC transporter permease [Bauldia sp.]|uniref:carbohydrate ABC transporter permease n=1 Tax=Bauldia sp. TaxID=2575872 RepID=UPI001D83E3C1|nr:carbohydrate ABC transporter permease [Bauldia sp.]MCB1495839.1 carbohydrate ABC transporter permease [Bauldia sp.]